MNSPFARLLWKEFRGLRALWLGCVLGTFGLWGVIALTMFASGNPHRAADDIVFLVWTLALWLPAIYIIGCNAALYAGEREERTAEWLTNLAVPFRSFLTAKLLWPAASGALMQLVMVGAALLIQWSLAEQTTNSVTVFDSFLPELPRLASFALVEALVLSWFWSLQFSRPLPAALASAGSLVAINLICGMLTLPSPLLSDARSLLHMTDAVLGPWGVLRVALLFGLAIASGFLTRTWLSGQPASWTIPWQRFKLRRKMRVAALSVEPGNAWRREWQRFRWLEWQSIRAFLLAIGVAALVLTAACLAWSKPGDGKLPLVWLILVGFHLPLMAGLAAWHGEQTNAQFRFLVNRGVSPVGLWLNKFSMWLAAVFLLIAVLAGLVDISLYLSAIRLSLPASQETDYMHNTINQLTRGMPPISHLAWSLAMLFSGTFAVSLYFRRTILAIGGAVLLYAGLAWWLVIADVLRLPAGIGIVPVAVWFVWCSLRHLPRWALERNDWRTKGAIAADWGIFPVVFTAAVTAYWIYSVPNPDVTSLILQPYAKNPTAMNLQTSARDWVPVRARLLSVVSKYRELASSAPSNWLAHAMASVESSLTDAQWSELTPLLRDFRGDLLSRVGMTPATDFLQSLEGASVDEAHHELAVALLCRLAERELREGEFEASQNSMRAAVRYAGAMHADAPVLSSSQVFQSRLHQELHTRLLDWAENPANTPDSIGQLLQKIETQELRWWRTDPLALLAEYEAMNQEQDRKLKEAGWRKVLLWPETARQRRLASTAIRNLHRFLQTTPAAQRNFAAFPPAEAPRESQILPLAPADAAWNYRLSQQHYTLHGVIPPHVPWGLSNESITRLWDRETRIRCTCAALAAIAYRRTHGAFPSTLADVSPEFCTPELVTDPWTGNLLQIRPQGLPADLRDQASSSLAVPARTPFVWSSGPDLATLTRMGEGGKWRIYGSLTFGGIYIRPTHYLFTLPVKGFPDALLPENGAGEN